MNMFRELLEAVLKCMIVFQDLIFLSRERDTENTMSHFYSNEKGDYFKENTYENEVLCSTIERN